MKVTTEKFLNRLRQKLDEREKFLIKIITKNQALSVAFLLIFIFFLGLGIRLKTVNESYLLGTDSFYWQNAVKSVLTGETQEYYALRAYTNPSVPIISFFVYLNVYIYRFINLFFNIDFYRFLFWFPAFIGALSVFPTFIIGKELFNKKVGLLAAFLATLAPDFLNRTMAGVFDTDSFNILFSTSTIAFFLISLRYARLRKLRELIIFAIMAGISLSLFALIWPHYGFIFWLLLSLLIFTIIFEIKISKQNNLKPYLLFYLIFLIIFLGITTTIKGTSFLESLVRTPLDIFDVLTRSNRKLSTDGGSVFPNLTVTIPESQRLIKYPLFLVQLIGEVIFIFAIPGLFLLVYLLFSGIFKKENTLPFQTFFLNENLTSSCFLVLFWFFPLFAGALLSHRFVEYLIFPISLLGSFSIIFTLFSLVEFLKYKMGGKNFLLTNFAIIGIISYCFIYPVYFANNNTNSTKTYINKNIEAAMKYLATNTPKNAVIVGPWEWGYWIESLTERPAVVDPSVMNQTKITPLENLGGINCAIDRNGYIENGNCITSRVQDIDITLYTKEEKRAVEILRSYLGSSTEMYYLLPSDLIYQSYWWSYFATWNSQDGKEGNHYSIFPLEEIYSSERILNSGDERIKEILIIEKEKLGKEIVLERGRLIEYKNFQKSLMGFLWIDFELKEVFFIPEELKDSLFVKLFFFGEKNSPYFKLEYDNKEIKIFKINFEQY